jgi:FKBP-type peptidyl-prolyl cis-trans isomerase SlyD
MAEEKNVVADNMVVGMSYKLTVDGKVLDEAGEHDAIHFLTGHKNIIPGLESHLAGMKIGESKSVTVEPEGGYGPVDESAFEEVAVADFPKDVEPKVGLELETKNSSGQDAYAKVVSVGKDSIKLDFNHPLAGKELAFDVKIVELRAATSEELSHGHVHSPGHHH